MTVNLLPQELRPKGYALKLSKSLKKAALIVVIGFLAFSVIVTGSYLLIRFQASSLVKKEEDTKTKIKALEQTEQKLVLVKDRLDRINNIEGLKNIDQGVDILDNINGIVGQDVYVSGTELKTKGFQVSVIGPTSVNLTHFLTRLVGLSKYSNIELSSVEYKPEKGYELTLIISK